jgi:hypothetical protein
MTAAGWDLDGMQRASAAVRSDTRADTRGGIVLGLSSTVSGASPTVPIALADLDYRVQWMFTKDGQVTFGGKTASGYGACCFGLDLFVFSRMPSDRTPSALA